MIKISVIIPNYNHAAFLKQRIDTILAQTYQNFELIILDDCSTDESKAIIESYRSQPKISHIVYSEQNSGSPFKQWQKGLELTKGDWIWIAESDDYCSNDFLQTAIQYISQNPACGLFYCDARIIEDNINNNKTFAKEKNKYFNTNKWVKSYITHGKDEINECLGISCTINNTSSTLMRKDLLNSCMTEVANFQFHGDWYCYLSIASKSDIIYSPAVMNNYRIQSSGIKPQLPVDGKNPEECFRIMILLFNMPAVLKNKILLRKFTLLNLKTGLISGFREWQTYFRLNKKLAIKVFIIYISYRLGLIKISTE